MNELAEQARSMIGANRYLALGTADPSGSPWVSPVYYTHHNYTDFYWVSAPETRHSRNLTTRPNVSLAIYDSHSPIGGAEAVYVSAEAAQVSDQTLAEAVAVYNRSLPEKQRFRLEDLLAPALFRLYCAKATEHWVLIRGSDPRYGRGADSRMAVTMNEAPECTG